jgi:hypothetical protein
MTNPYSLFSNIKTTICLNAGIGRGVGMRDGVSAGEGVSTTCVAVGKVLGISDAVGGMDVEVGSKGVDVAGIGATEQAVKVKMRSV